MKVKADWLDLKVTEYEDGRFEAHEALTNTSHEGDWESICGWIEKLLASTEAEIEKKRD